MYMFLVAKSFQGCVPVFEAFTIQGQYYWKRKYQCTLPQLLFILCVWCRTKQTMSKPYLLVITFEEKY